MTCSFLFSLFRIPSSASDSEFWNEMVSMKCESKWIENWMKWTSRYCRLHLKRDKHQWICKLLAFVLNTIACHFQSWRWNLFFKGEKTRRYKNLFFERIQFDLFSLKEFSKFMNASFTKKLNQLITIFCNISSWKS